MPHTPTNSAPATLSPTRSGDNGNRSATEVAPGTPDTPLRWRSSPPTPSGYADTLPPPPHTRCWAYLSQGNTHLDEKDRPPTYFQDQLKDAQRKWVAFRDAECNSVSSQYVFAATGAMSCASSNLCSALLTKHRSDELEANYELNDGPPMPASNSQPASKTQTYKNTTYGFQFDYPVAMSPGPGSYGNLKVQIVQLQIPQSYPKTNFVDAAFSVSASPAKTLVDCLASSAPANGDGFKTKTIINGADFYLTSGDDRGMGNIYQSKVYRAFAGNQTCIELDETLHTSNIGMYAPGTVTEVDQGPIWKTLDQVTSTFKFIK